jgi:SPP1 gp7 family putative phage head morphogenesis protein
MMAIEINFDLPFKEQIEFFRSKGLEISPDSWRNVWQDAHSRAFTVARVTEMDVLQDIRNMLDEAMETGMTLEEFKEGMQGRLEDKGWLAPEGEKAIAEGPDGKPRKRLTGWRLETIYRTNLSASYSVGRYKQLMEVAEARPWWQYMTVRDESRREAHASQHGKIYRYDHPFWETWYPPNGFNCRCYTKSLSDRQVDPKKIERQLPTETPDDGWQYNVGQAGLDSWDPMMHRYSPVAAKILREALKKKPPPGEGEEGANGG